MNENIDLTKILKDCPKGWKFYSSVYGEVEFLSVLYEREDVFDVFCNVFASTFSSKNIKYPIRFTVHGHEYCVSSAGEHNKGMGECTFFPSKEQRDWSKFTAPWYKKEKFDQKMVKPKFKVGDMVRHKETNKDDVYEISKVYDDSYGIAGFTWMIYMKYQDQYELIPNKFDPKTLSPFDKVLVRDKYADWRCSFFSHIRCFGNMFPYNTIGGIYQYCIPYNDETKHLVGTKDEAPKYYRYWED